jgi:hypothetical protein
MLTAGPRDTEIAAAILAGAAATFQRGRQRARAICRTIVANRDCADRWDWGLELGLAPSTA